jgi:hypothetical protein
MQHIYEAEELSRQRRHELLVEAEQRRLVKAARQGARVSQDDRPPSRRQPTGRPARVLRWLIPALSRSRAA